MTTQQLDDPSDGARPLAAVTGASSGIGREIALELAGRGFDLVVTAEDAELSIASVEFEAVGARVRALRCDLRRPEDIDAFHSAIAADGRPSR